MSEQAPENGAIHNDYCWSFCVEQSRRLLDCDCPCHATENGATGLESRYYVRRLGDRPGKHNDCRFFVLDPQHDPAALPALARYAQVVRSEGYTALADDLDRWIADLLPPSTPPAESGS